MGTRADTRAHLVFPEFVDNGLMEKKLDVFDEVKSSGCCGALVNFFLVFGFMGINALQDAQPPGRQKPSVKSVKA
jgi:hypothetical protein